MSVSSQKSHVETLTSSVMVSGDKDLKRELDHEHSSFMNRIRTLIRKGAGASRLFPPHVNTIRRPSRYPDLRLLSSRTISNFLLFKNHLAYGSLLQSQTKINKTIIVSKYVTKSFSLSLL